MTTMPSLLAELARARLPAARLTCAEKNKWVPTEEERKAIDEGTLVVFAPFGGPRVFIDLRAGTAEGTNG